MNTLINGIFKRDMALAFRQRSELAQPLMFLLMVITLFPLGIGPGPVTLQKIGPGVIWIAAILSSLLLSFVPTVKRNYPVLTDPLCMSGLVMM